MGVRRYSDDELAHAIAQAHSWRGVLRALGLNDSSAGSLRAARRHADRLGIDHRHFRGQRRWSDDQLREAIARADSWSRVATLLDCTPDGGTLAGLRTRALRLAVSMGHLERGAAPPEQTPAARTELLRSAAPMVVAAWFTVRGFAVAWPLEPQRYDLVAERAGRYRRVQVKTTTWRDAGGGYAAAITSSRAQGRASYSPGEIDDYFVLTRDLDGYLIPVARVAGRQRLSLRAYEMFKVMTGGNLAEAA